MGGGEKNAGVLIDKKYKWDKMLNQPRNDEAHQLADIQGQSARKIAHIRPFLFSYFQKFMFPLAKLKKASNN